jgi:hypothetical protein
MCDNAPRKQGGITARFPLSLSRCRLGNLAPESGTLLPEIFTGRREKPATAQ